MRISRRRALGGLLACPIALASPEVLEASLGVDDHFAPNADEDVWQPLRFLLGTWASVNDGQPGKGTGRRVCRLVLNNRFLEVRNTTTYSPQSRNPKGETHRDLAYISYDRTRKIFVMRQFHIEGFVNTYVANRVAAGDVQFTSESIENIAPGWRARATYRRVSDTAWIELFELAEPGADFAKYAEGRFAPVRSR